MDISIEKAAIDCSLGSLFQQIINDMKNSSPLWEDFIIKATKLHACLRAAIQAISTYLEAFQKIADAATNSKGASKEIGTALTRVCLRHKAVETRMKTFTTAIMDSLIIPLQDKLEEWKRQVVILDKDHTKEYKRCRNELKKRSSDTLRLQKKAKKGTTDLQSLVDSSMQTVNQQKAELDEVERKSLRTAMIEDRTRYCQFVNMLQPVVKQEYEMMYELGHLQEAMQTVTNVTKDPTALPQPAEELIAESKTSYNLYPDSPTHSSSQGCSNSLGSRKSSVCSISSMNSSGSSGSPGHQFQRSLSQYNPTIRLKPGESSDSGFCSSPALTSQISAVTSQSHAVSTWPPPGTQEAVTSADRPHTISTAYERGHQRPALTVYTFQNPETISESTSQKSPAASLSCRPPLPIRCSSLERPLSATSNSRNSNASNTSARQCPSPIPAHVAKDTGFENPSFVHLNDTNIVLMRDEFPDNYFQQTPAEIVVLRCKDTTKLNGSNNNSITDLNMIEPPTLLEQKQRLSSFKSDNNNSSIIANGGSPASSHYFTVNNAINNNPSIPVIGKNVHLNPFASSMYGQMDETSCNNNVNVNVVSSKPAITPRPASLLSGVSRIARRSSVNTVKPPPPVRRSSSVTPSNHGDANNITYSSQPSTPKLEKEGNSSMFSIYGTTTGNGNYSSNDIFGTMPRQTKSQQGVYAQPKQVATVSSFRTSSPNPPPKSTGLLASLTARITPNKSQNQQQQQQSESNYQRRGSNQYYDGQTIYGQQQSSPAMQQQIDDSANFGSESSVLSKTAPGFLDNLNAKLAEQRANNKAYAVRSYINSKVVPDPRIVRESLMDQIKRGATLKTTRSVNDR